MHLRIGQGTSHFKCFYHEQNKAIHTNDHRERQGNFWRWWIYLLPAYCGGHQARPQSSESEDEEGKGRESACGCRARAHFCGYWDVFLQIEKSVPTSQGISMLSGETKHSPVKSVQCYRYRLKSYHGYEKHSAWEVAWESLQNDKAACIEWGRTEQSYIYCCETQSPRVLQML